MSQKLALFNNLSLPEKPGGVAGDGPQERRRQKGARYHTQPITVEEVGLVRRGAGSRDLQSGGGSSSVISSPQLQKGPVQLPAFCLSPQLADRQQDASVNLKPSEVRLSQQRTDLGDLTRRRDSDPALRGILKKSCEGTDACAAPPCREQNGGGPEEPPAEDRKEGTVLPVPPRRQRRPAPGGEGGSLSAAPWRQRTRARRETIACAPVRSSEGQEAPQNKPLEQPGPPLQPRRAAGWVSESFLPPVDIKTGWS